MSQYTIEDLVQAAGVENADELCHRTFSTMGRPGMYRTTGRDDEYMFTITGYNPEKGTVDIRWEVISGNKEDEVEKNEPVNEAIYQLVDGAQMYT